MTARDLLGLAGLIPLLPLVGAAVLLLFGRRLGDPRAGWLATGLVFLSFAWSLVLFGALLSLPPGARRDVSLVWTWLPADQLRVHVGFLADPLSVTWCLLVTGVGSLIHLYAIGYMRDDPNFARFFAYFNLFAASMLLLVLADNYLLTFLGWEGVGLCSYLLISFWFERRTAALGGKKAFVYNRVGDYGFLLAMFLLIAKFGNLDYVATNHAAAHASSGTVTAVALLLFLACVGKSAQVPLFPWLTDAMEGPTPVSALIHAATMVTAGVYLIARSSFLFAMAPVAGLTVAVTGAVTALFAATIGLAQWDIKKVLAYSTVSQLGFMFIAVGVGAYATGIFHLVTHAFFKGLLFLGSGSVIYAMHAAYHHTGSHDDAQDMRNMGGLRTALPVTCVLMWIATLAIAGMPLFAGFFSKDEILAQVQSRMTDSTLAGAAWLGIPGEWVLRVVFVFALAAALLTAIYMTRLMLYTFYGPNRTGEAERSHLHEAPWIMTGPLVVLGVLSAIGGWLNVPEALANLAPWSGGVHMLSHWLEPVTGAATLMVGPEHEAAPAAEYALMGGAVLVAMAGVAIAFARCKPAALVPKAQAKPATGFQNVLEHKYYVDEIYDRAIVEPIVVGSRDVLWIGIDRVLIDGLFVNGSAFVARALGWIGSKLQTGQLGEYAWALALGVLAVLGALTLR